MNNLPKNSFSRAKQSMIENLQNNEELKTDVEIEADNNQNFVENNSSESPDKAVESQSR